MYRDKRILVVDDSEDDAFFLKRGFLKAGINAPLECVRSGEEAMGYLRDQAKFPAPKLVLLDIKMPGMDGFEVLEWLREQPGIGLLPVIMLSSSSQRQDVNRAYALGANSYMLKPGSSGVYEEVAKGVEHYWLRHNVFPEI